MIRTSGKRLAFDHAKEVQARRFASGRRGIAKAVRRFLKREYGAIGEYQRIRGHFEARWDRMPVSVQGEEGEAA